VGERQNTVRFYIFFTRETDLRLLPFLSMVVGFGGPCSGLFFLAFGTFSAVLHVYN